jgi:GH24 family phage-related lysozyme (muramidase)
MPSLYESHKTYSHAISLLRRWEGFESEKYRDVAGVETVGYGFTESLPFWGLIEQSLPLSEMDGERFLLMALEEVYLPVVEEIGGDVLHAPQEAAALASWVYNVGPGAARSSTLAERLAAGDEEGAEAALMEWVYADGRVIDGLVARREAERALMREGDVLFPKDFGTEAKQVPVAGVEGRAPTKDLADRVHGLVPERVETTLRSLA